MQTELFDINQEVSQTTETVQTNPNILEKTILSLRLDQMIGLILVLMVFYVISFSFGFEKGKRSNQNSQAIKPVQETVLPLAPEPLPLPKDLVLYEEPKLEPVEVAVVATVPEPGMAMVPNDSQGDARPEGKYTIQHVIYKTREAAEREVGKLTRKGQRAFIIPGKKYLQVCLSGFNTKKEADQYLRQLRSQHIVASDAYVRNMPV